MGSKLVLKSTDFRDGVQGRGCDATDLPEILRAVQVIDQLGVTYHEMGFAFGNDAAQERIRAALDLDLAGRVCAFARTHPNDVEATIKLGVPVGVLVGKTRARDAEISLRKTRDENLRCIHDSVAALVNAGLETIYDAEHLFQAWTEDDRGYAHETLKAAVDAGASYLVLCDTNGKMMPQVVAQVVWEISEWFGDQVELGIHTHNDRGRAIANAEAAFEAGVVLVEGTIGGIGERCGNMDILTFMGNARLDFDVYVDITDEQLSHTTTAYNMVWDALNRTPRPEQPYAGTAAFYTEAGMHQSGEDRDKGSYTHADPRLFGNHQSVGVTDQSGKANMLSFAKEIGVKIPADQADAICQEMQRQAACGIDFGLASASFHLFLLRQLGQLSVPFEFIQWRLHIEKSADRPVETEASLRMILNGKRKFHNADGDGPVNALDSVLQRTLKRDFPELMRIHFADFKVRTVDIDTRGSAATVRVRIDFSDGKKTWTTTALHENLLEACWEALLDGYIYKYIVNGN